MEPADRRRIHRRTDHGVAPIPLRPFRSDNPHWWTTGDRVDDPPRVDTPTRFAGRPDQHYKEFIINGDAVARDVHAAIRRPQRFTRLTDQRNTCHHFRHSPGHDGIPVISRQP
ncbi:hypothetical protein FZI85_26115 [Mycobacterium sp. CBMA293]|uniref:hypothetical protein n=1 Tax=unclassified Mycolicibacterium TaxID=2636767 RepID=UPI0012DD2915|nr:MULTISPECIES: hypothetical protein [unclassified Mycolicibacterium]MUL48484.1 hypothetical protein [Mycolicibacterium sp. CBMA 360]MUL61941.1 hypothetical protein [Mycolicibacterium sp. CBMA 335]MUL73216.1 hypothetical protein [Mycolicibacterium sp. CBMA 311]MUL96385.1 hypothetical protein [Mycolicibacterium sp. CBMA 230]MUM05281.1 hypothetical protein [Mycolicibacterium sp. CBMA 213]